MTAGWVKKSVSAVAAAMTMCGVAQAEPAQALDRISVWIGGSVLDTRADLDATHTSVGSLSKIDLGKGSQTVGHARLDLLVFDSQGFSFDYYSLGRSKNHSRSGMFEYDGDIYDLQAGLHSDFDVSLGSAAYHWWFGSNADVFGVGVGAAFYRAELQLDGTAIINGMPPVSEHTSWSGTAVAPTLTLAYKHAFSDSLRLYVDAGGVKKNGGSLSGHLYDIRAGVEWFPFNNFGFAVEYGKTAVSLYRERISSSAALDIDFHGPSLFARMRF